MFLFLLKLPVGGLDFLGYAAESASSGGSVANAWLRTVKHTKTLNFELNLRVLGGVCGSARGKQRVRLNCRSGPKAAD